MPLTAREIHLVVDLLSGIYSARKRDIDAQARKASERKIRSRGGEKSDEHGDDGVLPADTRERRTRQHASNKALHAFCQTYAWRCVTSTHLDFSGMQVGPSMMVELVHRLTNPKYRELLRPNLNFSKNPSLGNSGLSLLCVLIRKLSRVQNYKLKSLNVSSVGISDLGVELLFNTIMDAAPYCCSVSLGSSPGMPLTSFAEQASTGLARMVSRGWISRVSLDGLGRHIIAALLVRGDGSELSDSEERDAPSEPPQEEAKQPGSRSGSASSSPRRNRPPSRIEERIREEMERKFSDSRLPHGGYLRHCVGLSSLSVEGNLLGDRCASLLLDSLSSIIKKNSIQSLNLANNYLGMEQKAVNPKTRSANRGEHASRSKAPATHGAARRGGAAEEEEPENGFDKHPLAWSLVHFSYKAANSFATLNLSQNTLTPDMCSALGVVLAGKDAMEKYLEGYDDMYGLLKSDSKLDLRAGLRSLKLSKCHGLNKHNLEILTAGRASSISLEDINLIWREFKRHVYTHGRYTDDRRFFESVKAKRAVIAAQNAAGLGQNDTYVRAFNFRRAPSTQKQPASIIERRSSGRVLLLTAKHAVGDEGDTRGAGLTESRRRPVLEDVFAGVVLPLKIASHIPEHFLHRICNGLYGFKRLRGMQCSVSLNSLSMDECGISGLDSLLPVILHCKSLRVLNARRNTFSLVNSCLFFAAMQHNTTLVVLNLAENLLGVSNGEFNRIVSWVEALQKHLPSKWDSLETANSNLQQHVGESGLLDEDASTIPAISGAMRAEQVTSLHKLMNFKQNMFACVLVMLLGGGGGGVGTGEGPATEGYRRMGSSLHRQCVYYALPEDLHSNELVVVDPVERLHERRRDAVAQAHHANSAITGVTSVAESKRDERVGLTKRAHGWKTRLEQHAFSAPPKDIVGFLRMLKGGLLGYVLAETILAHNTQLQVLNLVRNNLAERDVAHFFRVFHQRKNSSSRLCALDVRNNAFRPGTVAKLEQCISQHFRWARSRAKGEDEGKFGPGQVRTLDDLVVLHNSAGSGKLPSHMVASSLQSFLILESNVVAAERNAELCKRVHALCQHDLIVAREAMQKCRAENEAVHERTKLEWSDIRARGEERRLAIEVALGDLQVEQATLAENYERAILFLQNEIKKEKNRRSMAKRELRNAQIQVANLSNKTGFHQDAVLDRLHGELNRALKDISIVRDGILSCVRDLVLLRGRVLGEYRVGMCSFVCHWVSKMRMKEIGTMTRDSWVGPLPDKSVRKISRFDVVGNFRWRDLDVDAFGRWAFKRMWPGGLVHVPAENPAVYYSDERLRARVKKAVQDSVAKDWGPGGVRLLSQGPPMTAEEMKNVDPSQSSYYSSFLHGTMAGALNLNVHVAVDPSVLIGSIRIHPKTVLADLASLGLRSGATILVNLRSKARMRVLSRMTKQANQGILDEVLHLDSPSSVFGNLSASPSASGSERSFHDMESPRHRSERRASERRRTRRRTSTRRSSRRQSSRPVSDRIHERSGSWHEDTGSAETSPRRCVSFREPETPSGGGSRAEVASPRERRGTYSRPQSVRQVYPNEDELFPLSELAESPKSDSSTTVSSARSSVGSVGILSVQARHGFFGDIMVPSNYNGMYLVNHLVREDIVPSGSVKELCFFPVPGALEDGAVRQLQNKRSSLHIIYRPIRSGSTRGHSLEFDMRSNSVELPAPDFSAVVGQDDDGFTSRRRSSARSGRRSTLRLRSPSSRQSSDSGRSPGVLSLVDDASSAFSKFGIITDEVTPVAAGAEERPSERTRRPSAVSAAGAQNTRHTRATAASRSKPAAAGRKRSKRPAQRPARSKPRTKIIVRDQRGRLKEAELLKNGEFLRMKDMRNKDKSVASPAEETKTADRARARKPVVRREKMQLYWRHARHIKGDVVTARRVRLGAQGDGTDGSAADDDRIIRERVMREHSKFVGRLMKEIGDELSATPGQDPHAALDVFFAKDEQYAAMMPVRDDEGSEEQSMLVAEPSVGEALQLNARVQALRRSAAVNPFSMCRNNIRFRKKNRAPPAAQDLRLAQRLNHAVKHPHTRSQLGQRGSSSAGPADPYALLGGQGSPADRHRSLRTSVPWPSRDSSATLGSTNGFNELVSRGQSHWDSLQREGDGPGSVVRAVSERHASVRASRRADGRRASSSTHLSVRSVSDSDYAAGVSDSDSSHAQQRYDCGMYSWLPSAFEVDRDAGRVNPLMLRRGRLVRDGEADPTNPLGLPASQRALSYDGGDTLSGTATAFVDRQQRRYVFSSASRHWLLGYEDVDSMLDHWYRMFPDPQYSYAKKCLDVAWNDVIKRMEFTAKQQKRKFRKGRKYRMSDSSDASESSEVERRRPTMSSRSRPRSDRRVHWKDPCPRAAKKGRVAPVEHYSYMSDWVEERLRLEEIGIAHPAFTFEDDAAVSVLQPPPASKPPQRGDYLNYSTMANTHWNHLREVHRRKQEKQEAPLKNANDRLIEQLLKEAELTDGLSDTCMAAIDQQLAASMAAARVPAGIQDLLDRHVLWEDSDDSDEDSSSSDSPGEAPADASVRFVDSPEPRETTSAAAEGGGPDSASGVSAAYLRAEYLMGARGTSHRAPLFGEISPPVLKPSLVRSPSRRLSRMLSSRYVPAAQRKLNAAKRARNKKPGSSRKGGEKWCTLPAHMPRLPPCSANFVRMDAVSSAVPEKEGWFCVARHAFCMRMATDNVRLIRKLAANAPPRNMERRCYSNFHPMADDRLFRFLNHRFALRPGGEHRLRARRRGSSASSLSLSSLVLEEGITGAPVARTAEPVRRLREPDAVPLGGLHPLLNPEPVHPVQEGIGVRWKDLRLQGPVAGSEALGASVRLAVWPLSRDQAAMPTQQSLLRGQVGITAMFLMSLSQYFCAGEMRQWLEAQVRDKAEDGGTLYQRKLPVLDVDTLQGLRDARERLNRLFDGEQVCSRLASQHFHANPRVVQDSTVQALRMCFLRHIPVFRSYGAVPDAVRPYRLPAEFLAINSTLDTISFENDHNIMTEMHLDCQSLPSMPVSYGGSANPVGHLTRLSFPRWELQQICPRLPQLMLSWHQLVTLPGDAAFLPLDTSSHVSPLFASADLLDASSKHASYVTRNLPARQSGAVDGSLAVAVAQSAHARAERGEPLWAAAWLRTVRTAVVPGCPLMIRGRVPESALINISYPQQLLVKARAVMLDNEPASAAVQAGSRGAARRKVGGVAEDRMHSDKVENLVRRMYTPIGTTVKVVARNADDSSLEPSDDEFDSGLLLPDGVMGRAGKVRQGRTTPSLHSYLFLLRSGYASVLLDLIMMARQRDMDALREAGALRRRTRSRGLTRVQLMGLMEDVMLQRDSNVVVHGLNVNDFCEAVRNPYLHYLLQPLAGLPAYDNLATDCSHLLPLTVWVMEQSQLLVRRERKKRQEVVRMEDPQAATLLHASDQVNPTTVANFTRLVKEKDHLRGMMAEKYSDIWRGYLHTELGSPKAPGGSGGRGSLPGSRGGVRTRTWEARTPRLAKAEEGGEDTSTRYVVEHLLNWVDRGVTGGLAESKAEASAISNEQQQQQSGRGDFDLRKRGDSLNDEDGLLPDRMLSEGYALLRSIQGGRSDQPAAPPPDQTSSDEGMFPSLVSKAGEHDSKSASATDQAVGTPRGDAVVSLPSLVESRGPSSPESSRQRRRSRRRRTRNSMKQQQQQSIVDQEQKIAKYKKLRMQEKELLEAVRATAQPEAEAQLKAWITQRRRLLQHVWKLRGGDDSIGQELREFRDQIMREEEQRTRYLVGDISFDRVEARAVQEVQEREGAASGGVSFAESP